MLKPSYKSSLIKAMIAFAIILSFSFSFENSSEFKSEFQKAYNFISNDNYEDAIGVLEQLILEQPNNANLKSMAGYCYLNSNTKLRKAIPILEGLRFPEDMTVNYHDGNSDERLAPIESLYHLGVAYHLNYDFEKAKAQLETYLGFLSKAKSEERYLAEKKLAEVNSAIEFSQKINPEQLIIPLKLTNSEQPEYRPIPNHYGDVMYFTSRRSLSGSNSETKDIDGQFFEDIYEIQYCRGVWSELESVSALNTDSHEAILYLSMDENEILMYKFNNDNPNGGDIMETKMVNGKWAPPTKLGLNINSKAWETHSVISTTNDIVFTSDRKGTKGFRDIWILHASSGEIENMGNVINTEEDEDGAFLADNGNTLYFSSNGHNTVGGFDIFVSKKDEKGKWGIPVNLGMPINSPGDDIFYYPVIAGGDAYFSSFRRGGSGNQDIYFVPNPERIDVIVGVAVDEDNNPVVDLDISVFDIESKKHVITYKTAEDGSYTFPLRPGQSYEVLPYKGIDDRYTEEPDLKVEESNVRIVPKAKVNNDGVLSIMEREQKGYARITDVVTVLPNSLASIHYDALNPPDDRLITFTSDSTTPVDPDIANAMVQFEVNSLFFVFDRITLIKSSRKDLNQIADVLANNKDFKLEITGHTDNLGNARYNKRLSRERAKKVKRELVKRGVKGSRITLKWVGANDPAADNQLASGTDNPSGRQENRRTTFILTK